MYLLKVFIFFDILDGLGLTLMDLQIAKDESYYLFLELMLHL